ncbi:MAG: 16S rRNA (cytidine(1402)-2'-O)-methyltransferase [Ignavibacteria bacterium]|nr:16S rRNA (cytidine(1402)-2'-O)-methyltransferase [Ignavibacteria bacterium]
MKGNLYLVSIPIGNAEDMTPRAIRVLKETAVVVVEEFKEGRRLLRQFGINREVDSLNEHNEEEKTPELIARLSKGESVALLSDAGTPVFSDPGLLIVQQAIANGIRVIPIPGASSLMPALIASGFPIDSFVFHGFLSPKREERIAELKQLRKEPRTTVIMETPYRLAQVLKDLASVFGESRNLCIAFDVTLPTEEFLRGTPVQLLRQFQKEKKKGEFVLVLGPAEC